MKKDILIITGFVLILSACGPSVGAVQTTIAQTQTTLPTGTELPISSPILPALTPTPQVTPTPIPGILLPVRGVIGPFEHLGFPSGFYEGQILRQLNDYDQFAGSTVAEEIALQLDAMHSMGINTVWFTLSAADPQPGPFVVPSCTVNPDLGPAYPQPTDTELANLKALFDLIQSKDIQVVLNLSNTNMEDQASSAIWLRAILNVVKDHPALYLVLFSGDVRVHDYNADGVPDSCGGRAEPNLWEGPDAAAVPYIKWALPLANSLGIPWRKLSAEAILGFYPSVAHAPNQYMTDGHYWEPEVVLKGIFDDLAIPNDQRTYAISFYEHSKCGGLGGVDIPCQEVRPHEWALQTMDRLFNVIGRDNGARVVAVEAGYNSPHETDWNTELALESLVWIYQAYGVEGSEFWLWTNSENALDLDPAWTPPVKRRGPDFIYNPVKDVLQHLYTWGQTDDLKLIPDTTPPVFASVAASPESLQNGDTLQITASLGETHLFVWAELADLDSDKTSQVVLIDQGDGIYTRQVSLSDWNIQPNGLKSLNLTAMDFWSNTSSTTVKVTLQNPPPVLDAVPPRDDFSGTTLDPSKWKTDSAGGALISQDGKVIISTSSLEKYSAGNVISVWQFPGDFDVQLDFQIGQGWAAPAEEHLDGAVFGVEIDGQRYWITRLISGGGDSVFSMNTLDQLIGQRYTDAVSGDYRIIRQGTKLDILFDIGEGWQRIVSKTVATSPAQVYFGNGSINASRAFTTYFDNFHINSGLTTYKP